MEDNMMTISVFAPQDSESEFGTLDMNITVSQDINITQLLSVYERLTVAMTYTPETWKDAIIRLADEYKTELNRGKHNA